MSLLGCAGLARAGFTPIPLDPTSFNHDPVIERTAPRLINDYVTVTPDQGTNKNGNAWYEIGYNTNNPTTGIPAHNSLVTVVNGANTYSFRMPPDYTTNNCIFVGHNNSSWSPILHPQGGTPGTFHLTTPANYTYLSVLNASGNGACQIAFVVHFSDGSSQPGTFLSTDWWSGNASSSIATRMFDAQGLIGMNGGINNLSANHGVGWASDILLSPTSANVTSIDFFWSYGSSNGHSPWGNGRTAIFALAGSTDGVNFNPIAVTGYDQDVVVEVGAPVTAGAQATAVSGVLTNDNTYCSFTMDGNLAKTGSTWYESGYYAAYPNSGIPQAGSTVTSRSKPEIQYTMPSTYVGKCAYALASTVTNATMRFTTPTPAGSLAFLLGGGNGGLNIRVEIQFSGGATETNFINAPDWFERTVNQPAWVSFGRVAPGVSAVNNTPDQFQNNFFPVPAIGALPGIVPFSRDPRNGGAAFPNLPGVRLYDAIIPVTNNTAAITSINLVVTNTGTFGNSATIFAVSGSAGAPPIITTHPFVLVTDSTTGFTNALSASARLDNTVVTKAWQGTNNVALVVSNVLGGGGVSYQWKRAPRGGGWRGQFFSDYDMSTFANVTGPNIGVASAPGVGILTISNATLADSADYLVVLSNPSGSVTSHVATVMVLTTNSDLLVGAGNGDVITKYTSDGSSGNGEDFTSAIDQHAQKWLSNGDGAQGLDGTSVAQGTVPLAGPMGYIVTPVQGNSIVTALRFYCANDTVGRDPLDYTVEGSNDGSTWNRITGGILSGSLMLPTARGGTGSAPLDPFANPMVEVNFLNATVYKSYRVTLTNVIDELGTALMQVAEIGMMGTLVPNPPVWIRQPLASVTVFAGTSPTWGAEAGGYPPPTWQWYSNNVPIPGATSATYTITNVQMSASGSTFYVTAHNIASTIQSTPSTLTVIPAPTQAYPQAVLANTPSAYWRLDESPDNGFGNSGVVANDYAGGHSGIYSNVSLAVPGYNPTTDPDLAARFGDFPPGSPIDNYIDSIWDIDFARAANTPGATFSVEAWVYGGAQTANGAIVTKGFNGGLLAGTATGTEQFVLDVAGTPEKFRFLVRDFLGNGHVAQSTITPADPVYGQPTWHHLVGVCDQPNGALYLYVDGELAGTGTIPASAGILSQPLPITIGGRKSNQANDYDNEWVGTIDDVAIYGHVLTASQVQSQYFTAQEPPVFSLQPVSLHTNENVVVSLKSGAYGPGTVTYQWYFSDGVNPTTQVGGQTGSNYTFTTSAAQNGNFYQVVASSAYGSVTSLVAQLTIESGIPGFVFQDLPASQTIPLGHVIQLRVGASGTEAFTYQWQKNGVNLVDDYRTSGTHTNLLTIGYAMYGDTGNYQVWVTNAQGNASSTVDAVLVTNVSSTFFGAGSTTTDWQINNGAGAVPVLYTTNAVQLTSNAGSTANSAFLKTPQTISTFNAAFIYQFIQGTGGADGVTFCIQNDSRGAGAVGGGGGSLGVSGITPSYELEINIYTPNVRGIITEQNGVVPAAGGGFAPILPVDIGNNTDPVQIAMTYNGTVLSVKFTDMTTLATYTTNYTVNIPSVVGGNTAYVGFTGADGGVFSTQIISWNGIGGSGGATRIPLQFTKVGGNIVLSWPASTGAFLLHSPSVGTPAWTLDQTDKFQVVGQNAQVTVPPAGADQFFRLQLFP